MDSKYFFPYIGRSIIKSTGLHLIDFMISFVRTVAAAMVIIPKMYPSMEEYIRYQFGVRAAT